MFMTGLFSCQQTHPNISAASTATAEPDKPVTTIYVVRHGEKETADPAERDPALNEDGTARAEALRVLLKDKPIDALYSTKYKRTTGTLKPLAEERQLKINTYEPTAFVSLKNEVLQNYTGKTVVIAGHSNTILNIVEAFGIDKPFAEAPESKYDHFFKITIAADNTSSLETSQYGKVTN